MKTKEEIEQAAIKYSDKVNMEGGTSWSLADAFKAGYEYSDQNTKPLIDEITTLESQFEQSDKMYSDLLAKKDDFKLKWENSENEIAELRKALKSEANDAGLIQEIKKVLYESAKKTEIPSGGFEINIQFEEQAKALINQFKITRNNK